MTMKYILSAVAALALLPSTVHAAPRVWIDTDPACGIADTADPDDCFALLHLLHHPGVDVVGISTVFGNASGAETTRIAGELLARARTRRAPPIFAGAASPDLRGTPGSAALTHALEQGSLTIVALGPLTNIAAALRQRRDLASRIVGIVAVMGKEPGEIFHPAEGSARALFGHGPIFSDMNFAKDPRAATIVFAAGVPVTLVPYAAGKTQTITGRDLDTLARQGGAESWIAARARGWTEYWRSVIGRDGFYPFDLVAAVVATDQHKAACAREVVAIRHDGRIGWFGFGPISLLFVRSNRPAGDTYRVMTCRAVQGRAIDRLLRKPAR